MFVHNRPSDARRLVRQGYGGNEAWSAATQGDQPGIGLGGLGAQRCGVTAVDAQAPKIRRLRVTSFADPAEAHFAARGILARHETEPCGKLPATVELTGLCDSRRNGGGDDRPYAWDGRQTLANSVAFAPGAIVSTFTARLIWRQETPA